MRASPAPSLLLAALLLLGAGLAVGPGSLSAQTRTDLTGSWVFSVTTENGTGTPSVTLEQEGEEITGLYSSPRLGARRLMGTFDGETLVFRIAPGEGSEVIMTFTGTLQEDGTLAGTADFGGMGGASFTAVRAGTRIGTGATLPRGVQPWSAVD
jgi:hypothetical protein